MPVAFIAILISYSFATHTAALPEPLQNYWLLAHTTLIFLAYAAFIAAFGFGLMYLIAERKIRRKTDTLFDNLLPSLGVSDVLGYRCAILGVILLTMGVIVGSLWTQYIRDVPVEMARCQGNLHLGDVVYLYRANRYPPILGVARTQSGVCRNHRFRCCPLHLCWCGSLFRQHAYLSLRGFVVMRFIAPDVYTGQSMVPLRRTIRIETLNLTQPPICDII